MWSGEAAGGGGREQERGQRPGVNVRGWVSALGPAEGPFSGPGFPALLSLALLRHSGTSLTPPSHFLLQD